MIEFSPALAVPAAANRTIAIPGAPAPDFALALTGVDTPAAPAACSPSTAPTRQALAAPGKELPPGKQEIGEGAEEAGAELDWLASGCPETPCSGSKLRPSTDADVSRAATHEDAVPAPGSVDAFALARPVAPTADPAMAAPGASGEPETVATLTPPRTSAPSSPRTKGKNEGAGNDSGAPAQSGGPRDTLARHPLRAKAATRALPAARQSVARAAAAPSPRAMAEVSDTPVATDDPPAASTRTRRAKPELPTDLVQAQITAPQPETAAETLDVEAAPAVAAGAVSSGDAITRPHPPLKDPNGTGRADLAAAAPSSAPALLITDVLPRDEKRAQAAPTVATSIVLPPHFRAPLAAVSGALPATPTRGPAGTTPTQPPATPLASSAGTQPILLAQSGDLAPLPWPATGDAIPMASTAKPVAGEPAVVLREPQGARQTALSMPLPAPPAQVTAATAPAMAPLPAQIIQLQADLPVPRRRSVDEGVVPAAIAAAAQEAPRIAIAPAAQGPEPALDLRRHEWMGAMLDRIEAARDAVNASDTRMRLAPDALGSVDVSIRQEGDRLHVHFATETEGARTLLTDAQPRLAALAESRGLKLGQASVDSGATGSGAQGQRQETPRAPTSAAPRSARAEVKTTTGDRIA